jgi:hypothetical protein
MIIDGFCFLKSYNLDFVILLANERDKKKVTIRILYLLVYVDLKTQLSPITKLNN